MASSRSISSCIVCLAIFSSMSAAVAAGHDNSAACPAKLNNCTQMVRPYLRDVRYMFPTTIGDVEEMCKMWVKFVDCVRSYVTSCFSDERRSHFNKAVEHSVDTVHAICSSDAVQREYLDNAECFKKVSVQNCGTYYSQLIDHVSSSKAHDDHICCSYGQFKRCVHEPLLRECGHRARNLMDHSMGFLINRCSDKEDLSLVNGRCPSPPPSAIEFETEPSGNDLSRARADRSFGHEFDTTTTTFDNFGNAESESMTSASLTIKETGLGALIAVTVSSASLLVF